MHNYRLGESELALSRIDDAGEMSY